MGLLKGQGSDKKPLFRQWAKAEKKRGNDLIYDAVEEIRLSSSEEWILIEGENSVALINADSKVGSALWQALLKFEGELKALCIVPATGKLGFDLEPMEDTYVHWFWEGESLSARKDSKPSGLAMEKFSLENMKRPSGMNPSTMMNSGNGTSKSRKVKDGTQNKTSPPQIRGNTEPYASELGNLFPIEGDLELP